MITKSLGVIKRFSVVALSSLRDHDIGGWPGRFVADIYKRSDGIFVRAGIEAAGGLREGEGEPSPCSQSST
jgi:hypothetical protein